ncbi:MAG: tyrosine-type recombinase/integrase [Lachnospiraceae bacterium]|jgi:site-specific recombinase XerD|nr:tyrosine-type recombinase/integrase [Lachnospiraceae bacterium]
MTQKEIFKNRILTGMKYHLGKNEIAMLETALSEALYQVEIVESKTLPATVDMTNEYILDLYELKRSLVLKPSTMKVYMDTAREFVRYINKPLVLIDREDIEFYLRVKVREGNTGTSMNNKRRKLNSLFSWMKKNRFIRENPVENVECFKEVLKPVDHMTADEVEQLKEGCRDKRDRALLEWLRSTAARKGEIPYININQINWSTGEVVIYGEKTETYRTVYLDGVALKYLREYITEERGITIRSSEPLFTRSVGNKKAVLTRAGIYAEVKRIAGRSGLDRRVYPHLFRKTTATNIVRRGGSTDDAGLYIGHKPQGVTARHYISNESVSRIFREYVEAI